MAKFYITTAIPYVNGKPHIGHALEYFQADTIRQHHQLLGDKTLLLSGADENALKNVQAAEKENTPIQEFLDRNSEVFRKAYDFLGVNLDVFQRGSDKEKHWPGVQKLWELCDQNGDIYKKSYTGLYCVGCESFKTEKELVDGLCPEHQKAPEKVTEENYFFKLSHYQKQLLELIESNTLQIIPNNKREEILSFIKSGLEDFSISRSKSRTKGIGVPVPNDTEQIIYVWFDALAIYITGIGFGKNDELFNEWWPADVHVIGKDINRFHTVYWPAMLLSAGLKLPKQVLVHSFINSGGAKMSKSLGNVIDPFKLVNKYGLEAVRYYLLSQMPLASDGDFTKERFVEVYTADLANGIGNLVARVARLCETSDFHNDSAAVPFNELLEIETTKEYKKYIETYRFHEALAEIRNIVSITDVEINRDTPWTLVKDESKKEELHKKLKNYVLSILEIASLLKPFLPDTAEKIEKQFGSKKITSQAPLFPRLSQKINLNH